MKVDEIIAEALAANNREHAIFNLTPFFEQFGEGNQAATGSKYKKDFRWEREWRIAGDYHLPMDYIVFCPDSRRREFWENIKAHWAAQAMADYHANIKMLDMTWSLERMILHLASIR